MHELKRWDNWYGRTTAPKFQRPMKEILKDVSTGKFITPGEKLLVVKYNNSQRLKNKRK